MVEINRVSQEPQAIERPPTPTSQRCYDWMVVTGNTHYAKNRSSFTAYKPITATCSSAYSSYPPYRVIGIGTVTLHVIRSPKDRRMNVIALKDFLHVPDAVCNRFCWTLTGCKVGFDEEGAWRQGWGIEGDGQIRRGRRSEIWYAEEFFGLARLVLASDEDGEVTGDSISRDGEISKILLGMHLTDVEKEVIRAERDGP